ncbi:MAG: hypothetical protein JW708_10940, partial [Vallitaleaceae bacterium]|nr:hypothetical protein [Vallitaleaceae bacterium]
FGQEIEELHQEVSDFQKEKTRVESEAASISQEFTMVEQEAQQCYQAFFKQGFEFQSHELIYTKEEMMKELIFEHEQRLMDKKRKLRYPISVLCEEEVFEKVLYKVDELQTKTQSLIVVRQNQGALLGYETHKDQELMEQLTDFHEKSQETERELALCEDKLYALQQLKEKHQSFFRQYPYEKYQSLMNQSRYLELEVSKLKNSLEEKQRNIFEKEGLLKELLLQRVELQEYSKNLDEKISKANEFEAFSIQYEEQRNREETLFIQWKDLEIQIRNARSELDRYVEELRAIEHYNKEYDYEMKKIKESSLYLEVVNFEAFCTNEDFSVLKSQRESIKSRLLGISSTRNQLVQRLQEQEKLNEHYQDQKTRLYKEAEYEIEEVSVFYSHEEDELFDQMMEGKKEIRSIENQVKQSEKERYALGTNREMLLKELHEKGLERIPFEGGIENAKQVIKIFEGTIQNREKTRLEKENRLVHDISFLGKLHNDLLVKEGSFQFLGAKMVLLSIKERKQLEINLQEEIYELFKKLTIQRNLILQEGEKVQKEKQKIMDYCDHSIKDYRLKEGLIQGLLQKETVAELESYKEKLSEIIDKTIQLANDDKRESDIELNNFLKHLFVYVQTMLHELDELQKKTSIEVQGELKQIFLFEIPSYEEHVAKEALRKYLEKIVDHYDEGIDEKEQRASMEEKLHINNLIPVVLENREIKVRCRKVSNDLLVNMTPLSWEFSNKWSGGEKWSKNMTLFLGILNYLAEKKQYLSVNQKRNRTVILDNPFGKASSKHVLDPVFFIAEKLGFQMIALTAHAEGQFISDYFPVVYSLRLRGASKDTKLVTAGRTINHVYLKENSPQSIERFKEVLQLDLFT